MDSQQDKMAQDFIKLWQDQLQSLMCDSNQMPNMMQMMQQMQQYSMSAMGGKNVSGFNTNPAHHVNHPQHSDDELLQLKQRVRECEQRIAELEYQLRKPSQ